MRAAKTEAHANTNSDSGAGWQQHMSAVKGTALTHPYQAIQGR